jgi:acyl-CoA thioesterase
MAPLPPASVQQLVAEATANLALNPFSAPLGIEIRACAPGYAEVAMRITPATMNAHGSAHGGALWTLADMAFGAAGQYGGRMLTVDSDLAFLRPARPGAEIIATVHQTARTGRMGYFHIILADPAAGEESVLATGSFTGRWVPG